MQTPKDRQSAAAKIFDLQKQISLHVQVGSVSEVARLQDEIAELQRKFGATNGAEGKTDNARTA